ncbi:DUF3570 domain-containing protein [Sphingobacterium faecium]|uniref:DUF3570 domain-containing protein n=1 Tax=Sphingobacterium faecium TaxID=34087 RepID=UPI00097EC227|nr:DUF3570 domain-containing protein [Sphingobacterium faecium]WGQ14442.1 DUF3570 domain-containing protein [Sphingobacterium faecium]SJN48023.1 hypothetical protein FM120_20425 [Sphingobacterium faecium PCAi_F2.5]
MKKIYLHVCMLFIGILGANGQIKLNKTIADSSNYQSRSLQIDEINLVSAYYKQNGNNSAVTGGIGTEKLSDFANTFDLQLSKLNKVGNKNTFLFEIGIDNYTSASSDKIDPSTISSASRSDTRIYPSLNWTQSNEKTGNSFGFTGSFSTEYDYQSLGAGFNLSRLSKNKNTQFDFKLSAFLDTWKVILPIELRSPANNGEGSKSEGSSPRNSFSAAFSLTQVINPKLQALIMLEPAYQKGLLATKYQRVYFTDSSLKAENLPDQRYKLPIAARLNYFATDRVILRAYYRFFMDNWGVRAHTAEIEIPVKLTSFISVSPFYRYNNQTGARYFAPYGEHAPAAQYYTSDYDLSTLNSNFYGAGIRIAPPNGVFGWQHLNMLELRYGHYSRSTNLMSDIISLNLKIK